MLFSLSRKKFLCFQDVGYGVWIFVKIFHQKLSREKERDRDRQRPVLDKVKATGQ